MTLTFMAAMMLMAVTGCKRDVYGDLFIKRAPVTFRVTNENGQALSNVSVKAEERDGFDPSRTDDGKHDALEPAVRFLHRNGSGKQYKR